MAPVDVNGNHVVEDIGGGRYITYDHLKPGSVRVTAGARLKPGPDDWEYRHVIGLKRHAAPLFQVQGTPSPTDANALALGLRHTAG